MENNRRKQLEAEREWDLRCVLNETGEGSSSISNGNGHISNTRQTCEQNGAATNEISHANGYHASPGHICNISELLTKPSIQQRLNAYRESKNSRIDKFLAHLDSKKKQYLQNLCPS